MVRPGRKAGLLVFIHPNAKVLWHHTGQSGISRSMLDGLIAAVSSDCPELRTISLL